MATTTTKPTCKEIMKQLEKLGTEQTKKVLRRHGATEPFFGVKIGDLKPIQKKIKKDHELALELYGTGNSDAMYLAGLIADETRMTKTILNKWIRDAPWDMIAECTVASVAAETPHAVSLGTKWMDSKKEIVAAAGWATLSGYVTVAPDDEIDLALFDKLLKRVVVEIHDAPNNVRDRMNGFVIAVGCSVAALKTKALAAAKKIGKVEVDMGDTACKVPDAVEYIRKVEKMGRIGKKRKSARC